MPDSPKLVAFAGSNRRGSFNRRLLQNAIRAARTADVEVEHVDLREYEMPLFDEDLESKGTPEAATAFKKKLVGADGFLIASPEYNSSISPLLKNAIDWASRPAEGEPSLVAFKGKACGLLAASPGALGGMRMLPVLRNLLMNIGVRVAPTQYGLGRADTAFDDEGKLKDEGARKMVDGVVLETIALARIE